jgi:hypothetical protein
MVMVQFPSTMAAVLLTAAVAVAQTAHRCGSSFTKYEGWWRVRGGAGKTTVTYELSAKPSFEVPGFVLKRLLKRDAAATIDRLTAAITSRGDSGSGDRPQ